MESTGTTEKPKEKEERERSEERARCSSSTAKRCFFIACNAEKLSCQRIKKRKKVHHTPFNGTPLKKKKKRSNSKKKKRRRPANPPKDAEDDTLFVVAVAEICYTATDGAN
jgi:hypothetical protein